MRLFFCFVFPPFAVLMHGKPISAFFNMLLCMFFWIPGVLHALSVNGQSHTSKQTKQIVRAIKGKKVKLKRKKPCPVHRRGRRAATSETYDDRYIGEGGTRHKRK